MTRTEFLLARIAEDEAKALAVLASVGSTRAGEPYSDGSGIADRDDFPSYPWGSEGPELDFMTSAGHPARVLAECDAKRRIVERALERAELFVDSLLVDSEYADYDGGYATAMEYAVELLATAYSDHPDFDPPWVA